MENTFSCLHLRGALPSAFLSLRFPTDTAFMLLFSLLEGASDSVEIAMSQDISQVNSHSPIKITSPRLAVAISSSSLVQTVAFVFLVFVFAASRVLRTFELVAARVGSIALLRALALTLDLGMMIEVKKEVNLGGSSIDILCIAINDRVQHGRPPDTRLTAREVHVRT